MTDPITTPAQMREALDTALADYTPGIDHAVRFVTIDQVDMLAEFYLHNRALPVSEPEPLAVRVKPLSDEDRDWIDARADELFRANERRRGGIRNQTVTPQDFRDYFVVTATRERVLSQIDAVSVAQVRAEPEPLAVNAVMCAAERDAQSRDAVDLTLFRQAIRAEALEEAAKLATSFLVGDPKNGVPLRNPLAHEIADAIRALMEKPE